MGDRILDTLRRKLDKWELNHLRQHAANLDERLERAQEEAGRERELADYWHEQATTMMLDMMESGETICLTKDGAIGVIRDSAQTNPFSLTNLAEGEIYVATLVDASTASGYHLILLPGDTDDASQQAQLDWAKSIGGDLPNRVEQALLFQKQRAELKKSAYWSNETHESESGYAWYQDFYYGYQYNGRKSVELRARAVRRLPICSFSHSEQA